MKKTDLLYVGAVLLSVAALIEIGKGLGKASKNRAARNKEEDIDTLSELRAPRVKREGTIDGLAGTETKAIVYLVDSCATGKCFARRYANWLLEVYGVEAMANGIFLSAVKDTGGFTYEEILSISEDYMLLNRFHSIIMDKYDDINAIYDTVVDVLLDAAFNYKGTYHCYDDISEAVTRERFIPFLALQLDVAIQAQNYPFYESILTSLIITLLPLDESEYKKFKQELYTLLNTTNLENLDGLETETYTFLKPEKDRIMRIFTALEEQLK